MRLVYFSSGSVMVLDEVFLLLGAAIGGHLRDGSLVG